MRDALLICFNFQGWEPKEKGSLRSSAPGISQSLSRARGIAAALASGNSVILKTASDTVLPAQVLCECFWRAGIPRDALQLLPCAGSLAGKHLLKHSGRQNGHPHSGTDTAVRMLTDQPSPPFAR